MKRSVAMSWTILLSCALTPAQGGSLRLATLSANKDAGFESVLDKLTDGQIAELHRRIEDARADKGAHPLFLIVQHEKENVFTIQESQLDQPYLFSSTIERGAGENGSFSTIMDDTFIFSFHRTANKIQLLKRQMDYRADKGTPELKAIQNSIPDDILASVDVASEDKTAHYLTVSAEKLFLQDPTRVGVAIKKAFEKQKVEFVEKESTLQKIAAFERNVEVQVQLLFAREDQKIIPITMRYSLTMLPDSPTFEPRHADPRVGFFTTDFQDLSRTDLRGRPRPDVHLINRWNVEKLHPELPVSPAKSPIVFWIEDTVPLEYRDAVRAGILAWNAAFEKLGITGAVVAKEVDKDMTPEERAKFDPANIAYNMIRWFVGKDSGFALGPSRVNPLTGEIFHASISVSDLMSRGFWERELVDPPKGGHDHGAYQREARERAQASLALLEARAGRPLTAEERREFIQQYLVETIAHEVGHTLGLRHNFKGSQLLSMAEMGKDGLHSSTVMDYLPAYIAPAGKPQTDFYQRKVGPYDDWAIEYGYRPLTGTAAERKKQLADIAARAAADPALAYGTDEDVGFIDPDAQQFDLGRASLDHAKEQTMLARDLWRRLEAEAAGPGADNVELRERFGAGISAYRYAVKSALPFIGGIRTSRDPKNGRFEPVPVAEQRRAFAFIEENVFRADPFQVSPRLLARLGNDVLGDGALNSPYPLADAVLGLQKTALSHLFDPAMLKRLSDRELFEGKPGGQFTAGELMTRVRQAVWSELAAPKPQPIGLYRRNLQKAHLDALIKTAKNASVPNDARAAAWRDLERLKRDLEKSLKQNRDETSLLHLKENLRRAKKATDPTEPDDEKD